MGDWLDDDDRKKFSGFGGGYGYWSVQSKKDPRWNARGRAFGSALTGPSEMHYWIEQKKKELGEPPDDCRMSFMKD